MWNIPTKVANDGASLAGKHTASEYNNRSEEFEKAVTHNGIALTAYPADPDATPDTNKEMMAESMSRSASLGIYCTDSGSANSYVLSTSGAVVAPKALVTGLRARVSVGATNTTASTVNAFDIGSRKLLRWDESELSEGDIVGGKPAVLSYSEAADSGTGAWLIEPWALPTGLERLPIHPEMSETNNVFTFAVTTGQIVINSAMTHVWRGWKEFDTANVDAGDRTFATTSNKTYHLRWHAPGTGDATPSATYPRGRYVLKDVSDSGYNPGTLAETDVSFDATYDDMFIARVVTDGSNVLTVTALMNKDRLHAIVARGFTDFTQIGSTATFYGTDTYSFGWARTPTALSSWDWYNRDETLAATLGNASDWDAKLVVTNDRYGFSTAIVLDMREGQANYSVLLTA